ncbi:MAG: hypothetical protein ACSLEM_05800 [Candidatus Malihini olakiniferum]
MQEQSGNANVPMLDISALLLTQGQNAMHKLLDGCLGSLIFISPLAQQA